MVSWTLGSKDAACLNLNDGDPARLSAKLWREWLKAWLTVESAPVSPHPA